MSYSYLKDFCMTIYQMNYPFVETKLWTVKINGEFKNEKLNNVHIDGRFVTFDQVVYIPSTL